MALLALCWNIYHRFDKPIIGWVAVAGVILITFPLTLGWIGGITDRSASKTPSARTSFGSDCVGPDGKHIGLGKEDCEKFNNAWRNSQQSQQQKKEELTPEAPKATEHVQNYTFDIPSLLGKNVDEIKTDLKPYLTKTLEPTNEQIRLGVKDWDMGFTKDGKDLLISYNIATRKVNDLFISTDDKSGKTKDKSHLLEMGNLKENDPRYKIEFIKTIVDPSTFTGVKIIPQ